MMQRCVSVCGGAPYSCKGAKMGANGKGYETQAKAVD